MKNKGFTLIEIMITLAIIAILATLAITNLLRTRLNANESCAIYALQTLRNCANSYRIVNSKFPSSLKNLGIGVTPYIDPTLASGAKHGYVYSLAGGEYTFSATARPAYINLSGKRSFFVDESGVIRYTTAAATATVTDPPLD